MIILMFFLVIFIVFTVDLITAIPLINRYPMHIIFGKPGSGKSTYGTKVSYEHAQKKWRVYTNDRSCKVPGVQYYDASDLKAGTFLPDGRQFYRCNSADPNSPINKTNHDICLIIDEAGVEFNNRNFKTNLSPELLEFFKLHRHRRVKIYVISQSYKDMDLKIRDLADRLWILKRGILKNFSVARPILITLDIQNDENSNDSGGKIVEKYSYDSVFRYRFIFLRKWIKLFNSYQ